MVAWRKNSRAQMMAKQRVAVVDEETFDRRGNINDGRAAWRRSTGAVCFVDNRYTLPRYHLRPTVFAPHHH